MLILGINGSPRKNGNSVYLLSLFMEEMKALGHETNVLDAARFNINPCTGCGNCETKGVCIFKDDFTHTFLPALIKADVVVISSPVYFYAFPAGIKAMMDRIQVMWSRKYRLKKDEFKDCNRKGILLAVGATHGRDLFDGLKLTAKYFFDAADIKYAGELCYRGIDQKGEMEKQTGVDVDIKKMIAAL